MATLDLRGPLGAELPGLRMREPREGLTPGKLPLRSPSWIGSSPRRCPRPLGQTRRPTERRQSPPLRILPREFPARPPPGQGGDAHPVWGLPGLLLAVPASGSGCGARAPGPSAGRRGLLAAERPAGRGILAADTDGRSDALGPPPFPPSLPPSAPPPPRSRCAPAARLAALGPGAGGGPGRMPPPGPPRAAPRPAPPRLLSGAARSAVRLSVRGLPLPRS